MGFLSGLTKVFKIDCGDGCQKLLTDDDMKNKIFSQVHSCGHPELIYYERMFRDNHVND